MAAKIVAGDNHGYKGGFWLIANTDFSDHLRFWNKLSSMVKELSVLAPNF